MSHFEDLSVGDPGGGGGIGWGGSPLGPPDGGQSELGADALGPDALAHGLRGAAHSVPESRPRVGHPEARGLQESPPRQEDRMVGVDCRCPRF